MSPPPFCTAGRWPSCSQAGKPTSFNKSKLSSPLLPSFDLADALGFPVRFLRLAFFMTVNRLRGDQLRRAAGGTILPGGVILLSPALLRRQGRRNHPSAPPGAFSRKNRHRIQFCIRSKTTHRSARHSDLGLFLKRNRVSWFIALWRGIEKHPTAVSMGIHQRGLVGIMFVIGFVPAWFVAARHVRDPSDEQAQDDNAQTADAFVRLVVGRLRLGCVGGRCRCRWAAHVIPSRLVTCLITEAVAAKSPPAGCRVQEQSRRAKVCNPPTCGLGSGRRTTMRICNYSGIHGQVFSLVNRKDG